MIVPGKIFCDCNTKIFFFGNHFNCGAINSVQSSSNCDDCERIFLSDEHTGICCGLSETNLFNGKLYSNMGTTALIHIVTSLACIPDIFLRVSRILQVAACKFLHQVCR